MIPTRNNPPQNRDETGRFLAGQSGDSLRTQSLTQQIDRPEYMIGPSSKMIGSDHWLPEMNQPQHRVR
jgi:hypothetical protein